MLSTQKNVRQRMQRGGTINQVGNMLVLFFHLAELKGALFGQNPNRDFRIQKGFCVFLSKSKNGSRILEIHTLGRFFGSNQIRIHLRFTF